MTTKASVPPPAPATTNSIYVDAETALLLAQLQEQSGLSRSAQIRHLIHKAALGDGGDKTPEIRKHVAALRDLVL